MAEDRNSGEGLRIVAFCVLPLAYGLVREWAARRGHRITLLVTTPGPSSRRTTGYREIVAAAPVGQDVLVTTRLRKSSAYIAALQPDLVLSFTFPYRIPPEITSVPRLGAVNLHPAPLPHYRGPNPMRLIYEGHPTVGATLHRTDDDFDTGPILSRHERPMPVDVTAGNVFGAWQVTMAAALDEGITRLLAGEPGEIQDHSQASYAAQFTPEEHVLNWNLPARVLQRRATALNFGGTARASIGGIEQQVTAVQPLSVGIPGAPAGTIVTAANGVYVIAAVDDIVQVVTAPSL